ncbi:hypothetical protein FHW16_000524 [Phyllobacterium myrsinacearum]|uniref:Uncharacterized protein n=1 Tax=Phyllobacterium myrsinacearum TaxID=28101 RepID=A0A839ED29_9HYPH|nr:hypothetical protein [Phyllobacterium myrsinacearum]
MGRGSWSDKLRKLIMSPWFDKLTMRESEDCRELYFARLFRLQCFRLALQLHSPSW